MWHRVLILILTLASAAVACRVAVPDDPLITMFVPSLSQQQQQQNPFFWLLQAWLDTNVLLYPIWERLYQVTTAQAVSSPCRFVGGTTRDDVNYYVAVLVLIITAAGVRLVTGHGSQHGGWLVFLVCAVGYWQGTQSQREQQVTIFEDAESSDLVMWMTLRLAWFVLANGLANIGGAVVTLGLAFFAGTAWGDYHYNQQVWQVWTQSWSSMLDDAWTSLFGPPTTRYHY